MNNLKLVQKSFPFGSTSLSVSDDRELTVVFKSLSNTNTFTIPIDQLLARPSEHRRINYVVLVLFSMSATISALSAYVLATTADYEGVGNKALIRSEEHTSELQSQSNLVCRLLLEKKI